MFRNYSSILSMLFFFPFFPCATGWKGKSERTKQAWPQNAQPKMLCETEILSLEKIKSEFRSSLGRQRMPKVFRFHLSNAYLILSGVLSKEPCAIEYWLQAF